MENGATATAAVVGSQQVNEPAIVGASSTLASVHEGDASATVTGATFIHASGVEPAGDFTATATDSAGHTWPNATVTRNADGSYAVTATRPVYTQLGTVAVSISEACEPGTAMTVTDSQQVIGPAPTVGGFRVRGAVPVCRSPGRSKSGNDIAGASF